MRRLLAVFSLIATMIAPASAGAVEPPLDEAGYWRLADAMQSRLDGFWNESDSAYHVGGGGADPDASATLLLVHAVAAQRNHAGPARNDRRARLLARRLVATPPFVDGWARPGSQRHLPGWVNSLASIGGEQHLVFDAPIVEALAAAWTARRELALERETVESIEDRVARVAAGRF